MCPRRRQRIQSAPPRGLVLDIHRQSREEGPGVRTLVLLKGCPLRCLWCHDPKQHADQEPDHAPLYRALCNNCYNCLTGTPSDAETQGCQGDSSHSCGRCGSCVETCAQSSVSNIGRRTEVSEIMTMLEKDREHMGDTGGLTISGGEPMSQFGFTLALMQAAHDAGFHTCLATSGVGMPDQFARIRPHLDLVIFDFKASDEMEHIQLTAISNDQILDNLGRVYRSGVDMILRCPMVPGINDSDEHLKGIAKLSDRYPGLIAIQLVVSPPAVRRRLEEQPSEYVVPTLRNSSESHEKRWMRILHEYGCDRAEIIR